MESVPPDSWAIRYSTEVGKARVTLPLACPYYGRIVEHARTRIAGYADGDEAGGHQEAQGREMGAGRCCLPHGGHFVRANGTGKHRPPRSPV